MTAYVHIGTEKNRDNYYSAIFIRELQFAS